MHCNSVLYCPNCPNWQFSTSVLCPNWTSTLIQYLHFLNSDTRKKFSTFFWIQYLKKMGSKSTELQFGQFSTCPKLIQYSTEFNSEKFSTVKGTEDSPVHVLNWTNCNSVLFLCPNCPNSYDQKISTFLLKIHKKTNVLRL